MLLGLYPTPHTFQVAIKSCSLHNFSIIIFTVYWNFYFPGLIASFESINYH